MGGNGEGEADVHAAGVALHRRVEEARDVAEMATISSNLRFDLGARHAKDGAIQEDVLAAGELGMKAGADLEQAARPAPGCSPGPRSAR